MKFRVTMATMLAAGACVLPAQAQPVTPQTASGAQAAQPHGSAGDPARSRRLQLARRYFAAVNVDGLTRRMMDNMLPAMMAQQAKSMPNVTPEMREALLSAVRESTAAAFPRMMDRMGELYADNFTEAELQKLVEFYESADGRRITAKNGQVVDQSGALMGETMSEMQADLIRRLCSKIDCGKSTGPAAHQP